MLMSHNIYIRYIMAELVEKCCVIRIKFLQPVATRKGLTTLIKFANIINDSVLSLYLSNADIHTNPVLVHTECKKRFTNPKVTTYVCSTVVFDGHGNGPSIKDHEHTTTKIKFLTEVDVNSSIVFQFNQQDFLANEVNKNKFIRFLMGHLSGHGYVVDQSSNDADTLIVVKHAKSGNPTCR